MPNACWPAPSNITAEETRAEAEQRRAAIGYLVWPAALYESYVAREPASSWYRQQIRQAITFGVRAAIWGGVALLWPLILSLLIANITATIVFYGIGVVLDVVLLAVWLKRALSYSKRAARGETFDLRPSVRDARTRGIPAKH